MELETNQVHVHQPLVKRAANGDSKAQTELYRLYCKAMYNTAYRMLENSTTAEDVMQEAFIQAFQALEKFNFNSTFGYWLKKIVINRSLNQLKKEKLMRTKEEEYGAEIGAQKEDFHRDQDAWSNEFSLEDIRKGIQYLAHNHKMVFQLYMIEGYDHEEIAEIMKITASTSRSQLSRAKRNLKEILITKIKQENVGSEK